MGKKTDKKTSLEKIREAKTKTKKPRRRKPEVMADEFKVKDLTALPHPRNGKKLGARERIKGEVEVMALEWALKYSNHPVMTYLKEIKGYSYDQAQRLLLAMPAPEWKKVKEGINDAVTQDLVKRHVDIIAEVQEQHVRASNIGMAKAIEMISKMQLEPLKDKDGKIIINPATKKPYYRGFRSIDLLNCMNSLKVAQEIYRRAMGLPNDGEGLAQILEKLGPIQNNTQINIHSGEGATSDKEKALAELSYDEIMAFVEHKRQKMKSEEEVVIEAQTASA